MSEHNHSVVWIDHREAKVFHFGPDEVETLVVRPDHPHSHVHHKSSAIGNGHDAEDKAFLHAVVAAIGPSKAVLVTGPGVAKTQLVKHIAHHDPAVLPRIAGVESVDHPSDQSLVAHARAYFKTADRLTAQKV